MLKRACLALFLVAIALSSPVTANELTPDLLQTVTQLAEEGDADSQAYLARLYEVGQGVPKDFGVALRWYRLAAAQGNTTARVNLGLMTLYGKGCEKNPAEAVQLFRQAAEQQSAHAMLCLGLVYQNGQGVPQDPEESLKWYHRAAVLNQEIAFGKLASAYGKRYLDGTGNRQDLIEAYIWTELAAERGVPTLRAAMKQARQTYLDAMSEEEAATATEKLQAWRAAHEE